jgi:hypothetical protein
MEFRVILAFLYIFDLTMIGGSATAPPNADTLYTLL